MFTLFPDLNAPNLKMSFNKLLLMHTSHLRTKRLGANIATDQSSPEVRHVIRKLV
ncbi:unnamed protein product [Moneuplotes crassus]|uniref:Uncharacterized protein n=1 Tax=Euplotes crassus TaxID=5936 RepID=A0AAD1Y4V4_EUPCR|nr:unnamed protein product [Moneuplotes crassus]